MNLILILFSFFVRVFVLFLFLCSVVDLGIRQIVSVTNEKQTTNQPLAPHLSTIPQILFSPFSLTLFSFPFLSFVSLNLSHSVIFGLSSACLPLVFLVSLHSTSVQGRLQPERNRDVERLRRT